jgi:hypothetical protein
MLGQGRTHREEKAFRPWGCAVLAALGLFLQSSGTSAGLSPGVDLREPMAAAANAIPPRLDPANGYRPWFFLKGRGGIPVSPEHAMWDFGDTTGRYLEALVLARRMGITAPQLSQAEERLERYLFKLIGPDGSVRDLDTGEADNSVAQANALNGLLALFEDSGDPEVRRAIEKLITAQVRSAEQQGQMLLDPSVRLEHASGSHLAGCLICPSIKFYELTGYSDALTLALGLSRWVLKDPVIGPQGEITEARSWEGHLHSWLESLAGCARASRHMPAEEQKQTLQRCKQVYDWVRNNQGTAFGWIATYPNAGSSETCAISSAIRLALELSATGNPEYLDDVERFVRNQVVEAQFRELGTYSSATNHATRLLLGCFDSQSLPNAHLGTRGGGDVGMVEGCCINGGMRALWLAWDAIQSEDDRGISVNLPLTRNGPSCSVLDYEPFEGRVDVIPHHPGSVRIRVPGWVRLTDLQVLLDDKPAAAEAITWDRNYIVMKKAPAKIRISVRYRQREFREQVSAGGGNYQVTWRGNVVVKMEPPGLREPTYQNRTNLSQATRLAPTSPWLGAGFASQQRESRMSYGLVPQTDELRDAAQLANLNMLARLDLRRDGQPFFRIYPFAAPPRAEHEKWDDADTTGRYVEGLILSRRISGLSIDPRETMLRRYLLDLYDLADGLCYTRKTSWTPRRACMFSQSSAMLGLLAWQRETGSLEARKLLDWQVDGLMKIAITNRDTVLFPKYEYDGEQFVNDPAGKDAPPWYGGRMVLPLVDYWQLSGREDVKRFLTKLVAYCTQPGKFVGTDGSVEKGEGWWSHLHGTMDMAAGVAEFGRYTHRPELIAWSKRLYDWVGRTQTTRYGFVADTTDGKICESCAIASRFRLGLALYRASEGEPFGEMDRFLRNQLLENQFVDTTFITGLRPETPRTDRATYEGIERMVRGTFQCWGTANDLLGSEDIEGCGTAGGVQALMLALDAQSEWREAGGVKELRVNLLFNSKLRARPAAPFTTAAPVAAELWSFLPYEGRVVIRAHEPIDRLAVRLPDETDQAATRSIRSLTKSGGQTPDVVRRQESVVQFAGKYALFTEAASGEEIEILFPLRSYETEEKAAGTTYKVAWKGSSAIGLTPAGERYPLYTNRVYITKESTPLNTPRYR